jgi:XTP/dITP diphosphohydrolase
MTLYVATTNPGKLRDFATAAAQSTGDRITIQPLPGLKDIPAPAEDEPTFAGNATIKALVYSLHAPGHIVLADDSGLEVDALNGAPGVRSARYAEDLAFPNNPSDAPDTDTLNNLCLLHALANTPDTHRQARYHCVLAAARDGQLVATASGTVEGEILTAPRGEHGFGYDPLFFLPELHRTMAQLDPVTRLSLSHRGRALQHLLPQIQPAQFQ